MSDRPSIGTALMTLTIRMQPVCVYGNRPNALWHSKPDPFWDIKKHFGVSGGNITIL